MYPPEALFQSEEHEQHVDAELVETEVEAARLRHERPMAARRLQHMKGAVHIAAGTLLGSF